jgi:type II secretory pathway component PulJ
MRLRPGSTLLELLASISALGLIAAACTGLMRTQAALLRNTSERSAAEETLRAGRAVLQAEMRDLLTADVRAAGPDSVALRVFRGSGIVCAVSPPRVTLRYRGVRQPDPTKDSLLIAGSEQAGTIRLVSSRIDPCVVQSAEQLIALEPDIPIDIGAIVLFYESGSYHLANNALRYRRGASGLQPITDDFIDHAGSQFLPVPGALDVLLRSTANANLPAQQARTRIRLAP